MMGLGNAMNSKNQYLGYRGNYEEGTDACFKACTLFMFQSGISSILLVIIKAKSIIRRMASYKNNESGEKFENYPKGLLFMGFSVLSGSAMRVLTHTAMAYGDLRVEGLVLLWGIISTVLVCISVLSFYSSYDVIPSNFSVALVLFMRGLFGALALYLVQNAYKLLPAGAASAVFYTNPCFTLLIAYVVLRENTTISELIGAAVSLAGVILIAEPWESVHKNSAGLAYACGAAIIAACAFASLRAAMCKGAHHMAPVLSFSSFLLLLGIILNGIDAILSASRYSLIVAGAGCLAGFISNTTLSLGFKHLRAGTGAIFRKTEVFIVYVLAAVTLKEIPKPVEMIGASLIVGGTSLVTLSGFQRTKP